jgi:sugar/nucleoside kinase (ribokinase family)
VRAAVAVIGNLARDVVDGGAPRPGGGPFHCGRALRLLGVPAHIVTKLAPDDAGALLRGLLSLGVPVTWRAASSTAVFLLDYDGQSRTTTIGELGETWTPADVEGWVGRALRGVAWLHVAPLARSDFPVETLAALARGRRLSLDAQGLVRPAHTGVLAPDREYDPRLLDYVTVLKLAEEEAEVVLDRVDRASIESLGVPEVLLTLGPRGSVLYADGREQRIRCNPVETNPTGAGDAFAAAYAVARSRGRPPYAAAVGATRLVEALLASSRP